MSTPSPTPPEHYEVSYDAENCILTVVAKGSLTATGITNVVGTFYPAYKFTGLLWDLMAADLDTITSLDLEKIAKTTRPFIPSTARKTAYVAAPGRTYARLCAYLTQTLVARVPVEYSVFTSVNEALIWLCGVKD